MHPSSALGRSVPHQVPVFSFLDEKKVSSLKVIAKQILYNTLRKNDVFNGKQLGKSRLERNKLHRVTGMQTTEIIRRPR